MDTKIGNFTCTYTTPGNTTQCVHSMKSWAGPKEGTGGPQTLPPGKLQVAIGSLRNTGPGTNLSQEANGPLGSIYFSREVQMVYADD